MIDTKCPKCNKSVRRCPHCGYFQCYVCGRFAYWDEECVDVLEPEHPPADKHKVGAVAE